MRKVINLFILGLLLFGLVVLSSVLFANEQKPEIQQMSSVVILGGLKLKDSVDQDSAEKLFYDKLIPAMKDIDGLRMRVVKRMPLPNEKPDANAYDYVMIAEVDNPLTLMQLMNSGNMNPKLNEFGKLMKEYAGEPNLKAYTVIADTDTKKEN